MTTYSIEQLTEETLYKYDEVKKYLYEVAPVLAELFGNKFDWKKTPIPLLVKHYQFYICRRDGHVTGHLICHIYTSPLDVTKKILYQVSLYAKPDSGRTAWHLFQKFIDIGKKDANHIITMLTSQTNIKPSTLENMGFKEIETLYRMEIK